jgi:hypothetical protein
MEEFYHFFILLAKGIVAIILYRVLLTKFKSIGDLFFKISSKLFYAFIVLAIVLLLLNSYKSNNLPNSLYIIDFIDFIIICQIATIINARRRK